MLLRSFTSDDWVVIQQYQYPNFSRFEIEKMISNWNLKEYDGKYFEMFAIVDAINIVGYVSLLEQENGYVSEGVEIFTPYKRQGFAYSAVLQLLQHAKEKGYRTVTAQVRQDNIASLALHNKLGFTILSDFTNKRGHLVYSLSREI